MGSIMSSISNIFQNPINTILIGLPESGKKEIIKKLLNVEIYYCKYQINSGKYIYKSFEFVSFDVLRFTKLIPIWRHYFEGLNNFIFVIDSTNLLSIEESYLLLKELLQNEYLINSKILIFLNKSDLNNSIKIEDFNLIFKLNDLTQMPFFIQKCSALTGEGLEEGFEWLKKI